MPPRPLSKLITATLHEPPLSPTPTSLLLHTLADLFLTSPVRTPPPDSSPRTLPFGFHHIHFPTRQTASSMLPDGAEAHYLTPAFGCVPPRPPKRLWAGGSVYTSPQAGGYLALPGRWPLECVETTGPAGGYVRAGHRGVDIWRRHGVVGGGETLIWERRTLVFIPDEGTTIPQKDDAIQAQKDTIPRNAQDNATPPPKDPKKRPAQSRLTLTPTLMHLFNFSALSFNSHRIHYDTTHARAEGLRNVVVHGPLVMILLSAVAEMGPAKLPPVVSSSPSASHMSNTPPVTTPSTHIVRAIEYRNLAPLYAGEPLTICARWGERAEAQMGQHAMWIEGPDGRLAVRATVFTAPVAGGSEAQEEELLQRFREP